ncbi:MAG: Hsp70 family protein, partial [Nocardioides sp.]
MGYRLGVDLGTTFTAAAVDDGTGATMLGLGNRALTVPSVVFLSADGTFLFGEAAERRAAAEPARSAREFKRRIGDTVPILLAGQPFSPQALSAKLLAWTTSIATQRQGAAPDEVVVTYPANWGGYKRELLQQVVSLADLPSALTCTEPEAAATQYASRARLSPGDKVAVYDLGGGTFDVCVLEKNDVGFTILGSPDGVEHLGGIDFDEAVFQHVVGQLGDQLAGLDPGDPQVTDGLARLRRECVDAKEALSSDVEATVAVALPGLSTTLRLTRAELDGLITSPLRDTLDATQRALRSAQLTAADLTTVVLVGGSSRIPLVSHLLQSEFGVRTAMDTHPKHDVALGAVRYRSSGGGAVAPAAAATVA